MIDHNVRRLLARSQRAARRARRGQERHSTAPRGARNTGIAATRARSVVAFLDDDAVAERDWLELLLRGYVDSDVAGVGGSIVAALAPRSAGMVPPEFDWVVGCTYRGLPRAPARCAT